MSLKNNCIYKSSKLYISFFSFFRMDVVGNPWQVESIEAFYFLKCPECTFYAKDDTAFHLHAVENHQLSFVFFGKPEVKILTPEEILDLPEKSCEIEDNETLSEKTLQTIANDSNVQIESEKLKSDKLFSCKFCFKPFSDLNNMKRHLKDHAKDNEKLKNYEDKIKEKPVSILKSVKGSHLKIHAKDLLGQTKILKRESCGNQATLNQTEIPKHIPHSSPVDFLAQVIQAKNCPTTFYCIFQLVWVPMTAAQNIRVCFQTF